MDPLLSQAPSFRPRERAWANHGTPGYFREVFPASRKWSVFAPIAQRKHPKHVHFSRRQPPSRVANWARNTVKMFTSKSPSTSRHAAHRRSRLTPTPSALFRRNYTMLAVVFAGAFAFELGFNNVMDKIWDNHNRGRQWKDIRHKYIEGGDEE
ncbi:hypothetical protein VTJ49DRAFT_6904 [Mycothermus thermophilus]|uniref:Complex III subunit 9 n=1 Tax=Humicola insolens TaxID=85995 RepID=A0ABR3VIH5_HUMIN